MPSPWQWLYSSRRKYDFSSTTDNGRGSARQTDDSKVHAAQPVAGREAISNNKPFWKRKPEPGADNFAPFSDSVRTGILGAEGRCRALAKTDSCRSAARVAEAGPKSLASSDVPWARQVKRSESFLYERLGRDTNIDGHVWDRPERTRLCLASTSDWLARKPSAVDREPGKGRDRPVRRPHVRDIFSHLHRRSSATGGRILPAVSGAADSERYPTGPRDAKSEKMAVYVPRAVGDSATSAALFGGRVDDYNPNPDWNPALGRFASSPASRADLAPSDRIERHQTSRDNTLAVTGDVRVQSSSRLPESTRSQTLWPDGIKANSPADLFSELEITSISMSTDDPSNHFRAGKNVEVETVFSSDAEVLY